LILLSLRPARNVMVKDMTQKQIDDLQTFTNFGHNVGVVPEKIDVRKYLQPF
jgi:hypothetical protein